MNPIVQVIRELWRNGLRSIRPGPLLLALVLGAMSVAQAADAAQTFASPEEAVSALTTAVKTQDGDALRAIFGPSIADIKNPDRIQATNEFTTFAAALAAQQRIVRESDTRCVLELGPGSWPFPVPIIQQAGRWHFDTAAGTEELLNRRVGRNELEVLATMRAYVDAQREYASRDRDGDEVLEYAQRLASTPGTKDGLYWPLDLDGEISPLGPLVAEAQIGGYDLSAKAGADGRAPFHGYFFKILNRQGKSAPGGKYDYLINGNLIGGFALVAWPAEYGHSGVMTFVVNQQGRVYQRDLGPKTPATAQRMKEYDCAPPWQLSPD